MMARIVCDIEYGSEENEGGVDVECTYATCSDCDHYTMSFGTSEASVLRCLALMREECTEGDHFYVAD